MPIPTPIRLKSRSSPDQLVLQLGARWAGVEFELRTDAGVFPVPVVVDESGILRMDLGGSTTYTLSCINSTVPIPDLEPTEPDTPPTTQQDPAPSQPPANNTSGSNTRNVVPRGLLPRRAGTCCRGSRCPLPLPPQRQAALCRLGRRGGNLSKLHERFPHTAPSAPALAIAPKCAFPAFLLTFSGICAIL